MRFRYKCYSPTGSLEQGLVEAESEARAEELLWNRNYLVISLKKERRLPSLEKLFPTFFAIRRGEIIPFTRELANLLGAGIPLLSSLNILYGEARRASFRRLLQQVMTDLRTGLAFSQALARHPLVFPPVYLRLVQVGEGIGNLPVVLRQLVVYMEREAEVKSRLVRSLVYPAFVVGLAILAVVILTTVVLPAMMGLFQEMGGRIPPTTRFLLTATSFIQAVLPWLPWLLPPLVLLVWWLWGTPKGIRWRERVVFRLPQVGQVSRAFHLAGIARTLSLLLGAGVAVGEALRLLVETTTSPSYREALAGVRSQVMEGQLLSQALLHPLFPPLFSQMVAVGEATGQLQANLHTLATTYEDAVDRSLSRMMGLLEPALILAVGALVAFIAVSIITPLYSLAGQLR